MLAIIGWSVSIGLIIFSLVLGLLLEKYKKGDDWMWQMPLFLGFLGFVPSVWITGMYIFKYIFFN